MTNPDMVPYSHNPPGHTCGLPCCSKDLQIQLRVRKPPRSCIGIQDNEIIVQNFIFKGKLKDGPGLENGFFSVQEAKETPHADIPKFGSVRGGLSTISEEQKNYPFLKGREITLPELNDPQATEKLYLEDFSLGESDDFDDFKIKDYDSGIETMKDNELDYYVSVKSPLDPDKGVPYNPKDLESTQIYPWDLLKDLKDNLSHKSVSEKGDDSSSSNYYSSGSTNYYEVLCYPEEKPLLGKDKNDKIPAEIIDPKHDNGSHDIKKKTFPLAVPLPALPPKPPVQNKFNHPPLRKPDKTKTLDAPSDQSDDKPNSDTDSSHTKYNTYSSVYSITNMANKMSKEAYDRFLSLNRTSVTQTSFRRDVRDFDFSGDDMPLASKNMALAITKAKLNHMFKEKRAASMFNQDIRNNKIFEENGNEIDRLCKIYKCNNPIDLIGGTDKMTDELKGKLMDFDDSNKNLADEDSDDENDIITPGFKNINVDGKIFGSRYSLDRGSRSSLDRESSYGDELCDRFLHLWETGDDGTENEDETKLIELLKQRLRDVDSGDGSPSGESFSDNPVTLIL